MQECSQHILHEHAGGLYFVIFVLFRLLLLLYYLCHYRESKFCMSQNNLAYTKKRLFSLKKKKSNNIISCFH
jgi:hypothetical protein